MRQRRHRPRLGLEPLPHHRIGGDVIRHHLDRDVAIQPQVARAIDLAHAAGAERPVISYCSETGTWRHSVGGALHRLRSGMVREVSYSITSVRSRRRRLEDVAVIHFAAVDVQRDRRRRRRRSPACGIRTAGSGSRPSPRAPATAACSKRNAPSVSRRGRTASLPSRLDDAFDAPDAGVIVEWVPWPGPQVITTAV